MLIELVNIGRDSELRYSASGSPILTWPAAYDIGYGENKKTQWIDCVMFGKKAESLATHLVKGKQIQISARDIRIETWQKNDGSGEGYKLCCTVNDIKFCRDGLSQAPQQGGYQQPQQGGYGQPQNPNQAAPNNFSQTPNAQAGYNQPHMQNYQNENTPNRSQPAPAAPDFDDD